MNSITRRTFVGGTVLVAVAIAAIFGGKVPGIGSGSGQTTASTEEPDPTDNAPTATESTANGDSQAAAAAGGGSTIPDPDAKPAPPPEVLDVVIDQHSYYVPTDQAGRYRRSSLEEVVDLAGKTSGNEDGVRVRIHRKESARVVAWSTLYDHLQDSGLSEDAISMPHELIK